MSVAHALAGRFAAAVVVAAIALVAALTIQREVSRSGAFYLRDASPAHWIRDGDPFHLIVSRSAETRAYRTRFTVDEIPASAPLVLRTTGAAVVLIDARPVAELPAPVDCNEPRTIELAPQLALGEHELEIRVTNTGASVVAASLERFGVATDRTWQALGRANVWGQAMLTEAPSPSLLAE
jgi:hypothetical protein